MTAAAAVAAVTLGMIGIGQFDEKSAIIDRLYGTLELFSFSFGTRSSNSLPVALEIARFLAPLTVAYAGFQAIAAIFVQQWSEFRVQVLFRDHVVVCGLGWTGLRFAITFRALGMKVVAIEKNPSATAAEECRNRGILLLTGDATDRLTLTKSGSLRARYLIAACGEDSANGNVALLVQAEAPKRQRQMECFVHISDDRLCALLEEVALLASTNELTHIGYFNVYRIGPRALLNAHGLTIASQGPPHFIVIGSGIFGRNLVVEAARRWHLEMEKTGPMRITVVAADAEAQIGVLQARYPALARSCRLVAAPGDLSDPDCPPLPVLLEVGRGPGPTVAFVCLEDDAAGLRAAIRARAGLEAAVPVVVCTNNRASSVTELLSESGSHLLPNVWSFEVLEWVCTPEILLNGVSETMAQAFHASYVRNELAKGSEPSSPSMRPWEELAETFRRSNRDLAFDIGPKLRTVNCAIEAMADWDTAVFEFSDEELEGLAKLEHDRWSADRRRDGWTYGALKDVDNKVHTDLVPWDQLTEEVKDKDREMVRLIPRLLATYAGVAVVRRPPSMTAPSIATVPAQVDANLLDDSS
jgi:voltage-gated potassium channel Kch